jgi:hypothetical protein
MKTQLHFPDGPTVDADILKKTARFAVHKTINGKKGWVITDTASLKVLMWVATQQETKRLRREIEELSQEQILFYVNTYMSNNEEELI